MTGGFLQFVSLFDALDRTTSTNGKRAALEAYFRTVTPADAVWAIFFLTGRRLRRLVGARNLRDWASEHTALPPWLIEESYHAVGDLAEPLAGRAFEQFPERTGVRAGPGLAGEHL